MERVKALADKFNQQLAQNADSAVLRQTAIQILSELEANPTVNNLPNNVSVIMPSVDYAQKEPLISKESVITLAVEKPVLTEKPKEVFAKSEETISLPKVETLETIVAKKEVADKIALEPIKDLRSAIGINDKFQFMENLFNKEEAVFESSIKTINSFKNFAEAQFWIKQNLRIKYNWEEESTVVLAFDQLVKRRFS
ncbi:MAG: hypothetical protein RL387_1143 [Bacteroidota bacterium]|jgi:hypothetical protein